MVSVHCPCLAPLSLTVPPPARPPLADLQHHALSTLLFCEECDAIRCDSCLHSEISCYFCPACLFEVPSASVRGERNRCARNCFQCPQCDHTLAVTATDPSADFPANSTAASMGEAPYYLACNVCLWDSKHVGIQFDKPTGLALQLQKSEEAAPETLEFDHLKHHFEPFVRRGLSQSPSISLSSSSILSSAMKPVDGTRGGQRYGSLFGLPSRGRMNEGKEKGKRDELERYDTLPVSRTNAPVSESERVRMMREMVCVDGTTSIEQRWTSSWHQELVAENLRPLRTLLQTKRTKRCPTCKHILIKPEQKASSTRFKIKLVASNYLPSIELLRRPPPLLGSRFAAIAASGGASAKRPLKAAPVSEDEPLRPGRTYTFELSFTNPLYEAIHVRLAIARPAPLVPLLVDADPSALPASPPYAVNLPSPSFPISAFAEVWEYDDEAERLLREGMDEGEGRKRKVLPGVVERKANRTTVMMEVAIARDTVGPIRASMLVTYVYQSDEVDNPSPSKSPKKGGGVESDVKSFSFWTLFKLGTVVPRSEASRPRSSIASSGTPRGPSESST